MKHRSSSNMKKIRIHITVPIARAWKEKSILSDKAMHHHKNTEFSSTGEEID